MTAAAALERTTPVWHGWDLATAAEVEDPAALATEDLAGVDALVVGLGASGLTAAVALAEAGATVVGVDRDGVGSGAAGANGGFLLGGLAVFHHDAVQRYGRRVAAAWYAASLAELARTVDEEPSARRTGSLRSAGSEAEVADLRAHADALRRDGVAVEEGDGPLGPALLLPDDGVIDPMARCRRLAGRARAAGARLVGGVTVTIVDGRVVAAGRVLAPRSVLVAVDGGLEDAVPALQGRVTSVGLQMLATAPQSQRLLDRPLYHRWGYDYAQQLPSGALAVGGGRDLEDGPAPAGPARPTRVVQDHLDGFAARLGATGAVTHRWAARSGYTRDRLPIAEEVAPDVHVVGGYSGHGNTVGTMLARRAAATILDRG